MLQTLSQQKVALGSDVILTLVGQNLDVLVSQMAKLWVVVDTFESSYSRFLPNSELTKLNMADGVKTVVSKELISLLNICSVASKQTGGIFSPLILPALQRSGYKNSFVGSSDAPDYSSRKTYDFKDVKYGSNWVILPKDGALDFGGCGKGFLADKLADITDSNQGIEGYWFSLGGDIVTKGNDEKGGPWVVAVQSGIKPEEDIANIILNGGRFAIATSGTIKRGNKHWHHLIDSSTNVPAHTDILSATICHHSATQADIMASCAVIAGTKRAVKLLQATDIDEYLLQTANDYIQKGSLIKRYNK